MLLGAETMFFAGLIGAFMVFRVGATNWPPPFQPRLPVGVTGVNTVILLISALTMRLSVTSMRTGRYKRREALSSVNCSSRRAVSRHSGL